MGTKTEDPILRTVTAEQYWNQFDQIHDEFNEAMNQLAIIFDSKVSFAELQAIKLKLQEIK